MSTRPGYERAKPSGLSKAQIFQIAEGISRRLGYRPGEDIHAIVRELGGRVSVETTLLEDPEHTGSLYVNAPGDFEIIVPSHTSLVRDRFTIAHELGHYYLHYLLARQRGWFTDEKVVALRRGSNRIEWEANWFAAGFLMPADDYEAIHAEARCDLYRVAQEFDVSIRAAEVRASDLGIGR